MCETTRSEHVSTQTHDSRPNWGPAIDDRWIGNGSTIVATIETHAGMMQDLGDRALYLTGQINGDAAGFVAAQLAGWSVTAPTAARLFVVIDSVGGDIDAALGIRAALDGRWQVTTVNLARCDSAANIIFAAGTERYAASTATFLLHEPRRVISRPVTAAQLNSESAAFAATREAFVASLSSTGVPASTLEQLISDEQRFTAADAPAGWVTATGIPDIAAVASHRLHGT